MHLYRKLSNCEKEVMEAIFEAGREMDLEEIRDAVNKKYDSAHKWGIQMLATFTARLIMRDLVIANGSGKFMAGCTRERYEEIIRDEVQDKEES